MFTDMYMHLGISLGVLHEWRTIIYISSMVFNNNILLSLIT